MHKLKMLNRRDAAASIALALAIPSASRASMEYPRGVVKFIVPFPPGGPTDIVARQLATRLQAKWGQPVILEFKPGAGTVIGVDAVAKSAPDGHTIGLVNTSFAINPSLLKKLPYDTRGDLVPITQVARLELALVAKPDAPFDTVTGLVTHAKRPGSQLSYTTAGAGSTAHLGMEMLKREVGIDVLHVPMKGSAPAYTELMAGRIDLMVDPLFAVMPHVRAGRMKLIATLGEKRARGYENVPTVGEAVAGFSVGAMLGLVARAGTPTRVIDRIQADVSTTLGDAEVRMRFEEQGMSVVGSSSKNFEAFVAAEMSRWKQAIANAGIQPE